MAFLNESYKRIQKELSDHNVTLVAVSKTKPVEDIMEAYEAGHRDFGENYVQELLDKYEALPKDIRWHFIGHLQSNKVKYIASFIHLVHGVDSDKLLMEINKQGAKINRRIPCLLQIHISNEETKFGLDELELETLITQIQKNEDQWKNVDVKGLMGMASFTEDNDLVKKEFNYLKSLYDKYIKLSNTNFQFSILSMGMSADYRFAIKAGSTMVRIGSLLFGART
jgi:hypothetical protein